MISTVEITLGTKNKSFLYSANCVQSFQSGVQPLVFKVKSSLARELKILVSVVRFRPGPPRILKTLEVVLRIPSVSRGLAPFPLSLPDFPLTRSVL